MKLGTIIVSGMHWMETQAVGHPYDLFLGRFKPQNDIFGDFADKYFHGSW